jgi:Asp-tRNA(Asn)/Glu-tRNA(Gln) amidotransferase A subunit family amidase
VIDLELCFTAAGELARQVRERERSPREIVENALARIEDVNPALNCFAASYPEQALAAADDAERALAAPRRLGPLHGVPFALKDLTPTRGHRVTSGSYLFADHVAQQDAIVGARLRAAGAILVARTTTPELAYSSFTRSPLFGITRNPWDASRCPGGSSGGSGAAVAAGCVPLAEGSDMGGSIRIPAAYCGVVGLKPSFGRIPLEFLPSLVDTIQHVGPLARTVDDARLFLAAAQGPDERDPLSLARRPELDWPLDGDVAGLRLGLSIDLGMYAVDAEIAAAVEHAAAQLETAGASVEPVELGFERELADAWLSHWGVYLAELAGDGFEAARERMDPAVVALIEDGLALGAVQSRRRTNAAIRSAWTRLAAVHEHHDALLCPTMSALQPLADAVEEEIDMTSVFNLTSACPALSVPCGFSEGGLPIGLQVVARRGRDDTALQIGAAVERLLPWAERRPPL